MPIMQPPSDSIDSEKRAASTVCDMSGAVTMGTLKKQGTLVYPHKRYEMQGIPFFSGHPAVVGKSNCGYNVTSSECGGSEP